eukprot:INCI19196.1.p2 GENE.INCI19196.1~~INCI19196.1.p2  ORF type:complete len:332 (+),score=53.25 INCI19196.1:69-1064(+)
MNPLSAAALAAVSSVLLSAHTTSAQCFLTGTTCSDSADLPTVNGTFAAMPGVAWDTAVTDASPSFFEPSGSSLVLHIPASACGFFAMVDAGSISFTNSSITDDCACDRWACQSAGGDFDVLISNTDNVTCASTTIVVGYGYASDSAANILQFAMLDVCDGSQIVVSTIDSSAVSDCPNNDEDYDTDDATWMSAIPCRSDFDCACVLDSSWTCGFFGTPLAVVTDEMTPNTCFKSWIAYLFLTIVILVVLAVIVGFVCACVKCSKSRNSGQASRATTKANVYELTSTPRRSPPAFGVPDTWGTNEVEIGASPMSQRYKNRVRAAAKRPTMGM